MSHFKNFNRFLFKQISKKIGILKSLQFKIIRVFIILVFLRFVSFDSQITMKKNYVLFLLFFINTLIIDFHCQFLPDDFLLKFKNSEVYVPVSVLKNEYTNRFLKANNYIFNSETKNWYYLFISGKKYYSLLNSEIARYVYVETSEPVAMNDSSRVIHNVNNVHAGFELPYGFTGKNIVLGIIDSGIDYLHEDFKDNNGKTRVYRYWDQSNKTPILSPSPYNYGMVWTNKDIDNGKCTTKDDSGHGTNVAGIAAGNGRANGKNKGMAPEATIVIVETNLSASNWTLTVADACDYIFKVADSLGYPVVINNSNGVQFGSHDGSDPASEKIEALLDAKPGRILVASAGNSGNSGKYHVQCDVDSDTSFYWVKPASNGIAGKNTIYVDMWSDSVDFTNISISSGANINSGSYSLRGVTPFRTFLQIYSKSPGAFRDTLYGFSGSKIAYIDYYASMVNHVARIEWVVTSIDSSNYYFQFRTTGQGKYDGWSGELNKIGSGKTYTDFITTSLPDISVYPSIKNYVLADTLKTIFSSYISSEKVITVGNISNRDSFIAKDGNTYYSTVPSGKIFTSSSKGPNRKNILKPDIVACGNFTLTSAPLYMLNDPARYNKVDKDGMHYANGGTSMASPVIAGIAALYLEKCSNASYLDFKNDLTNTAKSNNYSGQLPNFAYGFGIADALNLLKSTNNNFKNLGDSIIQCGQIAKVNLSGNKTLKSIIWFDSTISNVKAFSNSGVYHFVSRDLNNCISKDSIKIDTNNVKPNIKITSTNGNKINCNFPTLTLKAFGSNNYNWSGQTSSKDDTILVNKPGVYVLKTNINTSCEAVDSLTIFLDTIKPILGLHQVGTKTISCLDKPVLVVLSGANEYSWNNEIFNNNDSIYVSIPGVYKIVAKGTNGCLQNDSITIFKDPQPSVLILNNGTSQYITCKQKNLNLSAIGALNYSWNKGVSLNGISNIISDSGMVVLTGVDSNGCVGKDSLLVLVDTLKPKMNVKFIGSKDISCNDDPVVVLASGALNYIWTGGNNINYYKNSFSIPGKYFVTGTNSNGCFSVDSISIIKTNYPPIPTITITDSIIISSKSINYQWYLDGLELVNDTLQSLKIYKNGTYMVAVNLNGCVSTSTYIRTNLDVNNINNSSLEIFPNPINSNKFEILNLSKIIDDSKIKVFDISGKNINYLRVNNNQFIIDSNYLGIIFIQIMDDNDSITFKILKI